MQQQSHRPGWFVSRKKQTHGPYTWEQLLAFARQGNVAGGDKVYSPVTLTWEKASAVPGLVGPDGKPLRSRAWIGWTAGAATLIAVAAAVVLLAPGILSIGEPDLGEATYRAPNPDAVVETAEWGDVPANRVAVVLADGADEDDAAELATDLDAGIVGRLDYIDLWILETAGTTEADLRTSLDAARADSRVDLAFPQQRATLALSRTGVRCTEESPLSDSAYAGQNAVPHEMIGTVRAWQLLQASGLEIHPVRVGIVDDGIFDRADEFDEVNLETPANDDLRTEPTADPETGDIQDIGSHGVGVANVIGADRGDGGVVGIGSFLGDKLTMQMTNIFGYGYQTGDIPDEAYEPDNIAHYQDDSGQAWVSGDLMAIVDQVGQKNKVINLSWNIDDADENTRKAYVRFFEKMATDYPDVVFVCAAGNEGITPGSTVPAGLPLDNVVTVGNVNNQGTLDGTGSNVSGGDFEVTIAAPGHGMPHGTDENGAIVATNGGTSMAAPQVTAAIALMQSIDPNLTAKQIKDRLIANANSQWNGNPIPAGVGGGVLAVDRLVESTIHAKLVADGQQSSPIDLDSLTRIDLVATYVEPADPETDEATWRITASVPVGTSDPSWPAGMSMTILPEPDDEVVGARTQVGASSATATWIITRWTPGGWVHVERSDTEVCYRVRLVGPEGGPEEEPPPDIQPPATGQSQGSPISSSELSAAIEKAVRDAGIAFGRVDQQAIFSPEHPNLSVFDTSDRHVITLHGFNSNADAQGYMQRLMQAANNDSPATFHGLPGFTARDDGVSVGGRGWSQGNYWVAIEYSGTGDYDALAEDVYDILSRLQ